MPENGQTPVEVVDKQLEELEAKSEGKLEGLAARLTGGFWNKVKDVFYLMWAVQMGDVTEAWQRAISAGVPEVLSRYLPGKDEDVAEFLGKTPWMEADPTEWLKRLQKYADVVPGLSELLKLVFLLLAATGVMKANLGAAWELGSQTTNANVRPSVLPMDAARGIL